MIEVIPHTQCKGVTVETAGNWLTAAEIAGSWCLVDVAPALAPKQVFVRALSEHRDYKIHYKHLQTKHCRLIAVY